MARSKNFQLLHQLPEELLQDVLERLDKHSLTSLNLASRWGRQIATPLIWREVTLTDCHTNHDEWLDDPHDDTPLLRKVLILAKSPWIASCVNTLTHKCHLPPPALFHELPRNPFSGITLSSDVRTAALVRLAVMNMKNVQTLRIIFGHPNINNVLLRHFFRADRPTSIRRLWLENCRINSGCNQSLCLCGKLLPLELNFAGLESVRFRRMPLRSGVPHDKEVPHFLSVHSRGGTLVDLQDGAGGAYSTTVNDIWREIHANGQVSSRDWKMHPGDDETIEDLFEFATQRDGRIYAKIDEEEVNFLLKNDASYVAAFKSAYPHANFGARLLLDPVKIRQASMESNICQRETSAASQVMVNMLRNCSTTLTSLCLDWVFTMPYYQDVTAWSTTFLELFALRFPCLKAFQFRNAVTWDTVLPPDLYLLDYFTVSTQHSVIELEGDCQPSYSSYRYLSSLEFMEAHPNLQCLAWPMDGFFSEQRLHPDIASRVEAVIDNLGRTLVDLRVDAMYSGIGEPQSESRTCRDRVSRERRRRFTSDFAPKMSNVKSIKIEGGVPRDERREIIRALHRCPLEKIVMIGVCWPLGNTWGEAGRDLNETLDRGEMDFLEAEHKDAVHSLGFKPLQPPAADFRFEATYTWPPGPPFLHTIASFHADTVRELKFCGYKGAPILFTPTPITNPMLVPLKHFHKLESLILSMWLNTEFEEDHRDADVIKYWLDARSPASTSLVRITNEEPEGWERELKTKFAPQALAGWVTGFVGQFLSEQAKSRREGVHVRASMCVGDWGGIFDVDLWIGKGGIGGGSDVCLGFKGPREELEPERRRSKLESRRWF